MEIKISEATQEEKNNLFTFLIKRTKNECNQLDVEVDETEEYLELILESMSIQKFEIEYNGVSRILFNRIWFYEDKIYDSHLVVEDGISVIEPTGKIIKAVNHHSCFFELLDGEFTDITNDDFIPFGYLK
jgi:predicted ATP-dependent endonuclease of OLD family